MNYFKGKTVLITGAFGGFGRHFVSQLALAGANLILSDLKTPSDYEKMKEKNRIIETIEADLSTYDGCKSLYENVTKLGKYPDIIIHNAGTAFIGNYVDVPHEKSELVVNLNLLSVMRLNSLFLPKMIEKRSGHLLYVSSVAGFVATPFGTAYTTSKFGLRAFAMSMHGETKKYGIKSSIVYPFWAKTAIMKSQVFGNPKMKTMPDFFASEPDYVVRKALQGISKGKLHICPGFFSKLMWQVVRFVPLISEQRFMRDELIG